MNSRLVTQPLAAHRQLALEARFGLRVAAFLDAQPLSHDIEQRLRVAREQAVSRAAAARRSQAVAAATQVQVSRGQASLSGSPWWLPLASLLPLILLAVGLFLVDQLDVEERVRAAADIDSVLLADDLPPRAYADPGFSQYLRQGTP